MRRRIWLAAALGAVLASGGGLSAAADPAPDVIVLPAESQPVPNRPVLAEIERTAVRQGVPFAAAVDAYLVRVAGPVTRDAAGEAVTPDVMIDDLSAAELQDLTAVAEMEGTGLAEAIDRHGWQSDFMRVREELRESFPGEFAGATREFDGSGAWLGFSGDVPDKAVRLARTLPVTVRLQGGLGFSEVELAEKKHAVHDEVVARPDVATAATSYDVETGAINVKVQPAATLRSAVNPAAITANVTSEVELAGRMHVNVAIVADLAEKPEDTAMRGGGHLGTCTAGFTLRGLTGPNHKRIATAGHCGKSAETRVYQNHSDDGGQTTVTRFWWHQGEWGDLAYYDTGSFNALQTFYWDWNEKRYAESRSGRPSVGDVICHFGKTSGRSCAAVWDADLDFGSSDGRVVMNRDISEGGDSGGPWFYGTTAIGIHSGDYINNDVRRSAFTPAYLYRNRNFDVYTR